MKRANKIPRLFKLTSAMDLAIRKESKKTHRTQTAIVEMALMEWFKLKRCV